MSLPESEIPRVLRPLVKLRMPWMLLIDLTNDEDARQPTRADGDEIVRRLMKNLEELQRSNELRKDPGVACLVVVFGPGDEIGHMSIVGDRPN